MLTPKSSGCTRQQRRSVYKSQRHWTYSRLSVQVNRVSLSDEFGHKLVYHDLWNPESV
jgi:hypothetical protein